jgi:hypothetical protein
MKEGVRYDNKKIRVNDVKVNTVARIPNKAGKEGVVAARTNSDKKSR